ncbi:hypothetical protein D0865_06079 [Hortaea werneckii]|uniref:CSC1/OSCA1-like 7TM region domain-containing protein n=1 Tax=Hortaea werneckii TaxID=91943 RepID=A0A3M7CIM6_HORWE|nr:hypothetical protein D0865_06079 [Hortaea werneckii]
MDVNMATSTISSPSLTRRLDRSNDENIGSARMSNSASSVLSTLAPVAAYAAVWGILFLIFRRKFRRYYVPRTFLSSLRPEQRTPKVSDTLFGWIKDFYNIPDDFILNHHSLDGYLFLRFLKIAVICCFVGCLITWPILFPINATGGAGAEQLDILTQSNIENKWKLFAHAGCAIIFFTFLLYMITRESIFYINLRQAYLMSPLYASRMSSRTVLFTSVPEDYMDEGKLRAMLGPYVRKVWFATDVSDLEDKVGERDDAAMKLEAAETKLIVTANGARIKEEKDNDKKRSSSDETALAEGSGSLSARYIEPKQRPTHRLKPLIGKKVDTIDWCRAELKKLIPEVDRMQTATKAGESTKLNSVFVEFVNLVEAQAAYQSLTHHQALHMAPRYAGVNPTEVIWSNLRIKWWELVIRKIVTLAFVVALVAFWSIPVAGVASIANVDSLEDLAAFSWLSQIFDPMPDAIRGVITGLLPVIAVAILMALLPIILRFAAKIGGDPTNSAVELTVQNYFFAFQVVQVFLVATLGSAASSVGQSVAEDPISAPRILANKIPKASTFYLCYFVLQGLGVVSGILLSLVGLVLFMLLGKLLDKTPRKMYNRWIGLSALGWGTVFPIYTNLFVIAICYAVVAPLVLGFATIGLSLFYFAYRYNILFVSSSSVDTKGRIYPRALQQIFVGIYIAEGCLVGLFAIASGASKGAIGPLVLMIIMVVATALYHVSLNAALEPLVTYLPKSLAAEEQRLLSVERGEYAGDGGELGLPSKEAGILKSELDGTHRNKPNFFTRWLRPDIYQDYAHMRRMVPKDIAIEYTPEDAENAFYHPAINSPTPLLWIPRDPIGISKQEIRETSKVIPITDEGAMLNEKNKIIWDSEAGRAPIHVQEPYY